MPALLFSAYFSHGSGASSDAGERRVLVRREGRPMATDVSVQIAALPEQEVAAEAAAAACMDWFDEVDLRLSRFRPDSELSRLNAAGRWFAASETLFDVVSLAIAAARASDGLFDPALLPDLEALGYDRDFALIAQREIAPAFSHRSEVPAEIPAEIPAARAWRDVALDATRRRVRLPEGVRLDLGGIAKGWAADVALSRYCAPFPGALVNVGGDLRARGGPNPGEPWSVGIRNPREELAGEPQGEPHVEPEQVFTETPRTPYAAVVSFSRGGLATSGALRRWWLRDGRRQHHLLDPRTGRPMRLWIGDADTRQGSSVAEAEPLIATATVLAPTAARAEVAAKVALLRGYPDALRGVEAAWERYGAVGPETDVDAGVALALTFGSGEITLSSNFRAYLETWGTEGAALPMNVLPQRGPAPRVVIGEDGD